ncbi:hypothetical protein MMC07_003914 [Pseudocyphellaria aurata]|nr:hypothetical protein [Pseudocyphellaria aurata]
MTTESHSVPAPSAEVMGNPTTAKTIKPLNPKNLLREAIINDSIPQVSHALSLNPSLLGKALVSAVRKGSVSLTECLLTIKHAPVSVLTPNHVATKPSLELLKVVVAAG